MSQLVRDRERRRQPVVLDDRTRGPLAHGTELGQTQRVTLGLVAADLLPRQQKRRIVVEVGSRLQLAERLQHLGRGNA